MSLLHHDLPEWTNHGVHMSKVSEGQRSGELWRLSWRGWLFTGSVPWGGGGGTEKRLNAARGADVPCLLSSLVRAHVWTVICMSVDVTSGLQGMQARVSPDPAADTEMWSQGTWWGGGRLMVGLPWVEQRNTVSAEFSVCAVKPAITIFLILCWLFVWVL